MNCNTSLMNSWHTFSPNGRWMAFSSKARSPYTQLMLTHIDANGNDSPAIIVDNTTAGNRGVNIPEFVNIPQNGIEKINPEATEYYRLFNQAYDLMETKQFAEAIPPLREALQHDPDEPIAHYALATALSQTDQERDASVEFGKAVALNPNPPAAWYDNLAMSQARTGDMGGAIGNLRKSIALDPTDAGAEDSLGTLLFETGNPQEGEEHLQKAIQMAPLFADAHNHLGWELAKIGRVTEAIDQLQKAIELRPSSVEYHANLGYVMALGGNFAGAVPIFQKAVELSEGKEWRCLDMLASAYNVLGRPADAAQTERQALDIALQQNNQPLAGHLRANLEKYEAASSSGH
jgi:Flp pilus assembly protein TadD